MISRPTGVRASAEGRVDAIGTDPRLVRATVATGLIGGWIAAGAVLGLRADAYLLLGIPLTIAFQRLVVRRPLRALWLRDARPVSLTPRTTAAVVLVAIAPAILAVNGARSGDPVLVAYGAAGIAGAVGAVYALRALDADSVRTTIRATLVTSAILGGVMVAYRLATGGFHGAPGAALLSVAISAATYLPVVFVIEEVTFRGLLDPYLQGAGTGRDRATALYGSALWGVWHLPVAAAGLGLLTIPYLVAVHTALGWFLVSAWRRTGNLAAPGVAHAISDSVRNGIAVL